jgi:hypothetical protein
MKIMSAWLGAAMAFAAAVSAPAQNAATVPQFQVDPFWPKPLPNNWLLGQVSGIATDKYDRIWVVHRPASLTPRERAAEQTPPEAKCCVAAPPVLLFDQSGNLMRHWGGPGQGYQWPESEHGIFVDDNDFVWLAGNGKKDGQLLKFTMDGKFVLQIGKSGQGNDSNSTERLGSPADVAVDVAAKEVFAADGYGNRRVVVFDSETGAYMRHWGAYGKPPSDEKTPPYDPAKLPRSNSVTRCTASASTRTGWSMPATAATIACRFFARTGPSFQNTSSRRRRAAPARSTISCSRPTRSRRSST